MPTSPPGVAELIGAYTPRGVPPEAGAFARAVVTTCAPRSASRAKALLFATSRLGAFAASVGLEADPAVVLRPSVIERFVLVAGAAMSGPTRRTLRTNLRAVAARLDPAPSALPLPRERAKSPYADAEIAAYLRLADSQPTESRRMRATALVCLGAGAGLVGADLRCVRGRDITRRSGGLVVDVGGRRPRVVPVLASYHDRLVEVAAYFGEGFVVGGADLERRNVTSGLIASLAGGADLARLDVGRLRSTWLAAVADAIGLRGFMDAAGISCSQRLGDLVASLPAASEEDAVALLGAMR
ncbi:MAG: hypothetical protein ACYC1D_06130 [Acidimicrobiales bacterium]